MYSTGAFWYGEGWKQTESPAGLASDISGISFATAIVILAIVRVAMTLTKISKIFRNKSLEAGREEGREEERERNLAVVKGAVSQEIYEKIAEQIRRSDES